MRIIAQLLFHIFNEKDSKMAVKKSRINGESEGFDGATVFVLEDGSSYKQVEYYYHYRYEYRPTVTVTNDREIILDGISKSVRVEKIR